MNNLTISVEGFAGTGKSTMMFQIEKLLKENGYDVELSFDNHPDYSGDDSFHFHNKISPEFDNKVSDIKANTKITLQERQLNRFK